jgi:hypothetical protein
MSTEKSNWERLVDIKTDNFNRAMDVIELKDRRLEEQSELINTYRMNIIDLVSKSSELRAVIKDLELRNAELEAKLYLYESSRN